MRLSLQPVPPPAPAQNAQAVPHPWRFAACAAAAALIALPSALSAADLEPGLVQVNVTYQEYNPFLPWQQKSPEVRYGYGVVVDERHVITTESLVRNHKLVQLRKARTGERISATVAMADWQVNLACLTIENGALDGLSRPVLATNVPPDAMVRILQFDDTSALQASDARLTQVKVANLTQSPSTTLTFTLLADQNVNAEGAAVMWEGALAGLVMGFDRTTRQAGVLPFPVIADFLGDLKANPYPGTAAAGFGWKPLVDPALRRYLGVEKHTGGILVLSRLPATGASEVLKAQDVILEWDGFALDNLGYYEDPVFGRLSFPYLIRGRRSPGDTVRLRIVRDKAEQAVDVTLGRQIDADALIPENIEGAMAEYLFDGGIVIRELDGAYLRAHGPDWQQRVNQRLLNLYMTRRLMPSRPGERIVILAGVLPDPINAGYQDFSDTIVTAVNGEPVSSMKDVFRIVGNNGHLLRLTLQNVGIDLVLDPKKIEAANERLARLYGIGKLRNQRTEIAPVE